MTRRRMKGRGEKEIKRRKERERKVSHKDQKSKDNFLIAIVGGRIEWSNHFENSKGK